MLNETDQFALFFKAWLYLSEIAVSCFARCVAFRAIPIWFSGFDPTMRRDRRCPSVPLDGRYVTAGKVPRRNRSPNGRDIRFFKSET